MLIAATGIGVMGAIIGALVAGFLISRPINGQVSSQANIQTTRQQPASDAVADAGPGSADGAAVETEIEAAELAAIREELAFERDARFAMAEELDLVWAELAKLSPEEQKDGSPPLSSPSAKQSADPHKPSGEKWFDSASLLEAGLPAHEVERLRELYEAEQLEELYLRDVATREGWLSTPRYRKDLQRLKEELRVELGDEDYDRVMYASGKNNRVAVDDVLLNSAAAAAGLRKGDVILRYDGQLMLTPQQLRNATVTGEAERTTAVDVLRGTETMRFYVPRGPLGVRTAQARRPPK